METKIITPDNKKLAPYAVARDEEFSMQKRYVAGKPRYYFFATFAEGMISERGYSSQYREMVAALDAVF